MLRKLFLIASLGLFYGCSRATSISSPAPNAQPVINAGCSAKPGSVLSSKNVKQVSLEQGRITETGQLNPGEDKGYTFKAEKGAKLGFRTQDAICVWVFAPNNDLINKDEIPSDGIYTMQVAALKENTNFTLEIGFGNLSPTASGSSSISIYGELNQKKAERLVQAWLSAKSKIFAPPFDLELASRITTGPVYNDIVKPSGAVDWLKSSNSYYSYTEARIEKVWLFSKRMERPTLKASVVEDRVLRTNNSIDPSQSGKSTSTFTYYFVKEGGEWKIYDYKKEDS